MDKDIIIGGQGVLVVSVNFVNDYFPVYILIASAVILTFRLVQLIKNRRDE